MRATLLVLTLAASISFGACGSGHDNHTGNATNETPATPSAPPVSKLNEQGTTALLALLSEYYNLKDAFVATNAEKVKAAAEAFKGKADAFQAALTADSTADKGLQARVDSLKGATDAILAVQDKSCEQQRVSFEKVSDQVFALVKSADLKNARIYRQYCPMAFNDKGAYWLSNEEEIRNPYFGKKMLECGEVTDTLR